MSNNITSVSLPPNPTPTRKKNLPKGKTLLNGRKATLSPETEGDGKQNKEAIAAEACFQEINELLLKSSASTTVDCCKKITALPPGFEEQKILAAMTMD